MLPATCCLKQHVASLLPVCCWIQRDTCCRDTSNMLPATSNMQHVACYRQHVAHQCNMLPWCKRGLSSQPVRWLICQPGGKLPLLSARPVVTIPATQHHRLWPVANYTAWWQRHNLPSVVILKLNGWKSNPRPVHRESNALTISHIYIYTVSYTHLTLPTIYSV